jgi:hypothetical protein
MDSPKLAAYKGVPDASLLRTLQSSTGQALQSGWVYCRPLRTLRGVGPAYVPGMEPLMLVRDCDCLACHHGWAAVVAYSATTNLSGERSNWCPECGSRSVCSGPQREVIEPINPYSDIGIATQLAVFKLNRCAMGERDPAPILRAISLVLTENTKGV